MQAHVLRHGLTEYKQGIVDLGEANDLTPEGIAVVRATAGDLAQHVLRNRGKAVKIRSSRYGRTLYTAKIASEELSRSGVEIPEGIVEDSRLNEVENFEWDLFYPLVSGGKIFYDGGELEIDSAVTNPERLIIPLYFRQDRHLHLPERARRLLPPSVIARIESFEPYQSTLKRFRAVLADLNGPETHLLVGHEGYTGEFVKAFSGRSDTYLDRGKYFTLERLNGAWAPVSAQGGAIQVRQTV
ncbi:MAG: histidine phosphatase family protein [Nanoarchaeota archaeon]|nr:histidine phosphatase family protein [Nanoarchaeota archaeon]MBU0977228.1 histidine phosphatase family protein [Nanoarchaeota archaeon]